MRALPKGGRVALSRVSVIAVLFFLFGLLVAIPVDRLVRRELGKELQALGSSFQAATGFALRYDSLSPSILAGLAAKGLVIEAPDGRKILSARKVSIGFDFHALLGASGRPFISSFMVEGAVAVLSREDLDRLAILFGARGGSGPSLPEAPAIRLIARDLRLSLDDIAGSKVTVSARHLDVDAREAVATVALDGTLAASVPGLGDVAASASVSGSFSRNFDAARLRVAVAARTEDFDLKRQDFDLSIGQGTVELRKTRDSSPLDLYGRYDLDSRALTLSFRSEAFRPTSLFKPSGRLSFLSPWFNQDWSTDLELSMRDFEPATLRYDGRIEGTPPASILGAVWKVSVVASGDADSIAVRQALASGPEGNFSFFGKARLSSKLVDAHVEADARLLDGRLPIAGSFDISGSSGTYRVAARNLAASGIAFGNGSLGIELSKDGNAAFKLSLDLPRPRQDSGFVLDAEANAPLVVDGSYAGGKSPSVEASIAFGVLDGSVLEPLMAVFLGDDNGRLLASLAAEGTVIFRTDLAHFSWSTTGLEVRSRLFAGLTADVSASGSDNDIHLRPSTLSLGKESAQLAGDLSIAAVDMLSFSGSLQYLGVPYPFQGNWVRGVLNVRGDYGLAVVCRFLEDGVVGSLALGSLPVPLSGLPLSVSTSASFRYASAQDWSVAISSLSIIPSSLGGAVPGISATGLFGPEGGTISQAKLFDRVSTVVGSGKSEWGSGPFKISLELGKAPAEHYSLSASYDQGRLDAQVSFGASPLARFVQQRLIGALEGTIDVSGTFENLAFSYDIALRQGKFDDGPIDLHLAGSVDSGGYRLSDGLVQWQGFKLTKLQGGFEPDKSVGSIAGHFDSSVILAGCSFDFSAAMSSRARGAGDILAALADSSLQGSTADFSYTTIRTPRWPFVVDISPKGVLVRGGPGDDFILSMPVDGSFACKAIAPFPIHLDVQGHIRGDRVDAAARGISIEMPMLVALVGELPVSFKGGTLTGDLLVSGALADPEFSGALQLSDCELSLPGWINETAGPVSAPVLVDGKRLLMRAPSVPILNSRFGLDFELDFEGWVPTGVKVALRSLPGTRVPLETNILGVAIKGFAVPDIDLSVVGPILSVRGNLLLEDTEIVMTPATLAPAEESNEPPPSLLDIDLAVETGRGVHFYFPDRNYPVIAGNVVPGNHLAVRYDQERDDLSFKGEIDARGGDAFYIQRNFFLRSAQVVFNESSGRAFDPRVSMLAELRDSTADGPITVTLRADNQPISVFKPSITSDPPKSEADIALILGQGLLALDESGGTTLGRVAIAGSEFVPQLNVTKAFESRIRDALGLDVLYFNSQAVQRWLFSLAGTGNQSLSTLSDYLKETSLFAGKYLSDSIFLHASARLDADPLVPSGSLGIVSDVGVDFETPFGLLQWTFQPQHPEQLFVDDQSLSLSWRLPLK